MSFVYRFILCFLFLNTKSLIFSFSLICAASGSIAIENIIGDKGSPCLIALNRVNWENFERRPTLIQVLIQTSQKLDKGLVALYKISKLIAKTGNVHNIGE